MIWPMVYRPLFFGFFERNLNSLLEVLSCEIVCFLFRNFSSFIVDISILDLLYQHIKFIMLVFRL